MTTFATVRARAASTEMRVGIQGEWGSFSEEAAREVVTGDCEPVPFRDSLDVTQALAAGEIDLGLLPVENSLAGAVLASYDAILAEPNVRAIGEVTIPIHHCVLGVSGATLADVRLIESHPMALAQCREFLRAHAHIDARASHDTAGSAREVARRASHAHAALASARAAERYGLEILARNVEDRADNATRFLVLATSAEAVDPSALVKTIAVYATANVPGALVRSLEPLAVRRMNLMALQARPAGTPWSYRFIVEFAHAGGVAAAREVLEEMAGYAESIRHVGTFTPAPAAPALRTPK